MGAVISTIIIGIFICVIGAINMTGNISSLHSYHRHRVKDEDVKPFGKMVGLGTLICGISVILMSIGTLVAELTENEIYVLIGSALLIIGIIAIILAVYSITEPIYAAILIGLCLIIQGVRFYLDSEGDVKQIEYKR